MTREEFVLLYKKHLEGACTPQEEELLIKWRDDIELLDDQWESDMGDKPKIHDFIFGMLSGNIKPDVQLKQKVIINYKWLKIAATILIFLGTGLYFVVKQHGDNKKNQAYSNLNNAKILPGTNKAYLTLANGSRVVLDDQHNGKVATQSGIQLRKEKNGKVIYTIVKSKPDTISGQAAYNTITTPRGGQYEVVLVDGTTVRLNAASSLRFPLAFNGKDRQVELKGEGYFEVFKNKDKPFLVRASGTTIRVLGTHFNISAYPEDDSVSTTLVEGSVRLSRGKAVVTLVPGQQGSTGKGEQINVKQADVEENLAWLKGFFIFHDENIVSVMKKVSRWYDIDVEYKGSATSTEFGGSVSRYENIEKLMNIIKLTGAIDYKIEGRRVIIKR